MYPMLPELLVSRTEALERYYATLSAMMAEITAGIGQAPELTRASAGLCRKITGEFTRLEDQLQEVREACREIAARVGTAQPHGSGAPWRRRRRKIACTPSDAVLLRASSSRVSDGLEEIDAALRRLTPFRDSMDGLDALLQTLYAYTRDLRKLHALQEKLAAYCEAMAQAQADCQAAEPAPRKALFSFPEIPANFPEMPEDDDDAQFQSDHPAGIGRRLPAHRSMDYPDDAPSRPARGRLCRECGGELPANAVFCFICGARVAPESPKLELSRVRFSAVAPKTLTKGEYSLIEILMYEDGFRSAVEQVIAGFDGPAGETQSGVMEVEKHAHIRVVLSSPDLAIDGDTEETIWCGEFARFTFSVELPADYRKRQILFVANVYINDIIATRLKFVAKCRSRREQKIEVTREDVLSAFVSYASQDRHRVARIIQGMQKARPDMDIFFDVESLRSGEAWESALWAEIDRRDVLFLCWSHFARESKWVDAEWRYAMNSKGVECIEPVPLESPDVCPPPNELTQKHFNDKLLYVINAGRE